VGLRKPPQSEREHLVQGIGQSANEVWQNSANYSEALKQRASAAAAVTFESQAADVQLGELWQQFKRKGVFDPVLVDDGRDLFLEERAHLVQRCQFLRIQEFGDLVKVAIWRQKLFGCRNSIPDVFAAARAMAMGLLLVLVRIEPFCQN
jgi:hypothetical protein